MTQDCHVAHSVCSVQTFPTSVNLCVCVFMMIVLTDMQNKPMLIKLTTVVSVLYSPSSRSVLLAALSAGLGSLPGSPSQTRGPQLGQLSPSSAPP